MAHNKSFLPRSARIHIRRQKAEIRRAGLDIKEEQARIAAVYARFLGQSASEPLAKKGPGPTAVKPSEPLPAKPGKSPVSLKKRPPKKAAGVASGKANKKTAARSAAPSKKEPVLKSSPPRLNR